MSHAETSVRSARNVRPRELSERELHEYVAEVESHDSQVRGIVGYFYRMYRAAVLERVQAVPLVLCADGYDLPFRSDSFSTVLLIAVLEHTREPRRVLAEAHRVLKPGGRVVIVVPNDITMSAGGLVLGKFPIRYPDHVTFTTPGKLHRWLAEGFRLHEAFTLPFRSLPFAVNLYYFVVAEKR